MADEVSFSHLENETAAITATRRMRNSAASDYGGREGPRQDARKENYYQNAQASEGQHHDTLSAAAEVAFAQADAPAAASEASTLNSAQDDYGASVIKHLDVEANTLATADGVRMTGLATADAAWLVAAAGADKDEQVRTAQLTGSANPMAAPLPVDLYNQDMAAARLTWVTGRDSANTGWTTSQAGADQQFAIDDAGSWQSLITTSAGAADTFAHADDAAVAASNDAAAQITADDMNAQATADQAQATADAQAEADFSDAEANQTSTEWHTIVQQLAGGPGTAWAKAEADKAATEANWQTAATGYEARGPTVEWLRNRGKTWEEIIESATRSGGADLGLAKPN